MYRATSDRIDVFFALVSKFLRAEAVAVKGLKMEMYASISGRGGGSLCESLPSVQFHDLRKGE